MNKFNIKTPPNEAGFTFMDYLRLISRRYHHAKSIIQTFYPHHDSQYLQDLHAELNYVAWWAWKTSASVRETFRFADKRFYYVLRHVVGLKKIQLFEDGHYRHVWVPEIELDNKTKQEV